jgi:hypothetical protein
MCDLSRKDAHCKMPAERVLEAAGDAVHFVARAAAGVAAVATRRDGRRRRRLCVGVVDRHK